MFGSSGRRGREDLGINKKLAGFRLEKSLHCPLELHLLVITSSVPLLFVFCIGIDVS